MHRPAYERLTLRWHAGLAAGTGRLHGRWHAGLEAGKRRRSSGSKTEWEIETTDK